MLLSFADLYRGIPLVIVKFWGGFYMHLSIEQSKSFDRICEIYGGPIEILPRDLAGERLGAVNRRLSYDPCQTLNCDGEPGGIITLPKHLAPTLIGDLHARVDNLLTVLCENHLIYRLEEGTAALVFLGDAVHEEEGEHLADMDSSALIMDLIFTLMLRFPTQVFYLTGNHDSYSPEIVKEGVPQGPIWSQFLASARGQSYEEEMARFYRLSPILALSEDFVACHAGPPLEKVSLQKIIDVNQHPRIRNDLTWNRVRSAVNPMGYRCADVKRFRRSLQIDPQLPFIVGHSPLSGRETIWENLSGIPDHHLVYSAHTDKVGVIAKIAGKMASRVYAVQVHMDPHRSEDSLLFH